MTWDRVTVFAAALAFMGWANYAPNNMIEDRYGRGFPLKWTFDSNYRPPPTSPPTSTPPNHQHFPPPQSIPRCLFRSSQLSPPGQ